MQWQDIPKYCRSFIISDHIFDKMWKMILHCLDGGRLIEVSKLLRIISVYNNYIEGNITKYQPDLLWSELSDHTNVSLISWWKEADVAKSNFSSEDYGDEVGGG